ncbi:hypothetical protein [Zhenhengia yiwuensis]
MPKYRRKVMYGQNKGGCARTTKKLC